MGLFLMGILLWSLVIASVVLFVYGLWKRSWKALAWSGAALLLPMGLIAFDGSGSMWFKLSIVPPLLIFAAAYFMKHKRAQHMH
ncbi:MAG TPA: hypothetical protein VLQ20_09230 [Planococcus sp. (in: firmicutes)]|nr:hypothetical protein [Planococcus sp. (in: firmicutes)]